MQNDIGSVPLLKASWAGHIPVKLSLAQSDIVSPAHLKPVYVRPLGDSFAVSFLHSFADVDDASSRSCWPHAKDTCPLSPRRPWPSSRYC